MESEKNKPQWDSTLSFIMAMIGSAIGLGNIWRYPYVVYSNGGGAFLIPYLISILIIALPFLYLEYVIGFEFKTSVPNIYKKVKKPLEVVGWFICFVPFLILIYYVVIIGWDIIYLVLSITKGWGANTNTFFTTTLLHSTTSISGLSHIIWPVLGSLIIIWSIIWYISRQNLNNGIGRFSKILIPLLVGIMAVVVIYSITLPGANIGINALFKPKWDALFNLNIWLAAAGQIIFSLSLGWGVISTYSSYLPKNSNLIKNGGIVAISNCSFELLTAIGVFSILGFMSITEHVPINHVVTEGTGLIFVAFPMVFNKMGPYANIIGPLFFLCVFFAGITTTISLLEPISNAITQKFKIKRENVVTILCAIGFIVSTVFATGMGTYLVKIADSFLNNFGVLFGIVLEGLIFGWLYNNKKLLKIINKNGKIKLGNWWVYLIKYIIPILLIGILANGIYELILNNNWSTLIFQLIIGILLVIFPTIFTLLPKREEELEIE
ncbi:sodium-dependent transporter [uncultured Methanobrevibacter sp.]|uniref:sodium-dependent transporter n=1 Tax=uncultured Methanobrevibacter sp. TaxID=253161 RepID=UPI0025D2D51E|nr:sodium-dependent transporter [uncultured Methanobrevibacter sp.]